MIRINNRSLQLDELSYNGKNLLLGRDGSKNYQLDDHGSQVDPSGNHSVIVIELDNTPFRSLSDLRMSGRVMLETSPNAEVYSESVNMANEFTVNAADVNVVNIGVGKLAPMIREKYEHVLKGDVILAAKGNFESLVDVELEDDIGTFEKVFSYKTNDGILLNFDADKSKTYQLKVSVWKDIETVPIHFSVGE